MMRPMVFEAGPAAPSALNAVPSATPDVALTWTNNATLPAATMYTVQRADDAQFTQNVQTFTVNSAATTSYHDITAAHGHDLLLPGARRERRGVLTVEHGGEQRPRAMRHR